MMACADVAMPADVAVLLLLLLLLVVAVVVPYPPPAARCLFLLSAASMSLWLRASLHTWKASRCSSLSPELIMAERVCPRLTAVPADDVPADDELAEREDGFARAAWRVRRAANCSVLMAARMSWPVAAQRADREGVGTGRPSQAHTLRRRVTRRISAGGWNTNTWSQ